MLREAGVLGFGLLEREEIGVGVFPEGEEILVVAASGFGIAGKDFGTGDLEVSERSGGGHVDESGMVEELLKFGGSFGAIFQLQISEATKIAGLHAIEISGGEIERLSYGKNGESFFWVVIVEFNSGPNRRKKVVLNESVFGLEVVDFLGEVQSLRGVADFGVSESDSDFYVHGRIGGQSLFREFAGVSDVADFGLAKSDASAMLNKAGWQIIADGGGLGFASDFAGMEVSTVKGFGVGPVFEEPILGAGATIDPTELFLHGGIIVFEKSEDVAIDAQEFVVEAASASGGKEGFGFVVTFQIEVGEHAVDVGSNALGSEKSGLAIGFGGFLKLG